MIPGGPIMARVAKQYLLFCWFGAAIALSGCTGQHPSAAPKPTVTHASVHHAPAPSPTSYAPWQDPAEALSGDKVWVSTGRRTGGLELDLPAKAAGGTVWVSTECQGVGTLHVDAGPYDTHSYPCSDHPSSSLSASGVRRAPQAAAVLKVTATPGVRWAVAVGWGRGSQ